MQSENCCYQASEVIIEWLSWAFKICFHYSIYGLMYTETNLEHPKFPLTLKRQYDYAGASKIYRNLDYSFTSSCVWTVGSKQDYMHKTQ